MSQIFSSEYFTDIVLALGGILIVNLIVRVIQYLISSKVKEKNLRYGLRSATSFFGYFLIFILLIGIFSNQLSKLAVVFGVAGAGIAFALQEVIVSVAGWIALSFGQFYAVGDRVQLGGIKGDVIDIGILRTTVMEIGEWVQADQYSGRIVKISNGYVFKEPVFNYSGDFPFVWDEIKIPVKYGSDRVLAKTVILDSAIGIVGDYTKSAKEKWGEMTKKYAVENANVEPTVFMTFNDNWIEFSLRYVVEHSKRRTVKDELSTKILDSIDDTKGVVGIASTTVHIVEIPRLNMSLKG